MNHEEFGTSDDYTRAFDAVIAEGIPPQHLSLLREHFASPDHSTTWADLARRVGYPDGGTVNLQYGILAARVAQQLGMTTKPKEDFWLYVLAGWADELGPKSGHTSFVLRCPVIGALTRLGIFDHPTAAYSPIVLADEVPAAEQFWEGALRRITVNAYERDAAARRACIAHFGAACRVCGFDFGAAYGELGSGFIHVHHTRPLSEVRSGYSVDPKQDLIPVCPNCHAMLHQTLPPLTIAELQKRLQYATKDA